MDHWIRLFATMAVSLLGVVAVGLRRRGTRNALSNRDTASDRDAGRTDRNILATHDRW